MHSYLSKFISTKYILRISVLHTILHTKAESLYMPTVIYIAIGHPCPTAMYNQFMGFFGNKYQNAFNFKNRYRLTNSIWNIKIVGKIPPDISYKS